MGETKVEQQTTGTTTPTATPEETELNRLQLEQMKAIQPESIALQKSAFTLGNLLLKGQDLPGFLEPLPRGATAGEIPLSAGRFDEDMTNQIVQEAMRNLMPQFQKMGVPIESGVAASVAGRTSGDIRRGVAEGNIERELAIREANLNVGQATEFQNINTLLNLLNLAVGGQAQIQQPVIATGGTLGQRLAGLRSVETTGTTTQTRNPFLENFYGSLGTTLGSPKFGAGSFSFGG